MSAPRYYYKWAIAMYAGENPLTLQPLDPRGRPTLTARDVTDVPALAVADPFLIRHDGLLHLFFEVLNAGSGRGEIGVATSGDGTAWDYQSIVLREPFHLSYPQIFAWDGGVFMIPETRKAGAVRLYRADAFPGGWRPVATLLEGDYADATIHRQGDDWYLFAQRGLDELRLFRAGRPDGPWREHPASPLWTGNRVRTRPGGRLFEHDGRLIRLAQDAWPNYGSALRAYEVERLDPTGYAERELPESPIFAATRSGWNALAMHHMDLIRLDDGRWLGAVDGATLALG